MTKSKKKTNEKNQDLHVRVTKREKERLMKEAENLGLSVSEYIRPLIRKENPIAKMSELVVLVQDIITHVQEKYSCEDDEELAYREERLWKIL